MKKIIISIFIVLFLVGCSNKTNEPKEKEEFETYNEIELDIGEDYPDREHIINIILNNSSNVETQIGEIIKEKVYNDFDINDFKVFKSQSESNNKIIYIYDYGFVLEGAETDIGYTVFVENNKVTKVYDNMQGYVAKELKESSKAKEISTRLKNFTETRKEEMRKFALESESNSNKKITGETVRYDVKKDRLYYSIEITVTDSPDSEYQSIGVYDFKIKI